MHEIFHILGLQQSLATNWKDASGNAYVQSTILLTPVTIRSKSTKYLATPQVLTAVRTHFNCPTAKGAQLENHETASTTSHLERTVFRTEIMSSGLQSEMSVISVITAAWLQDTGWYFNVNSDLLQPLIHGKNKGCTFYEGDPCNPAASAPEFCQTLNDESQCTLMYDGGGSCQGASAES